MSSPHRTLGPALALLLAGCASILSESNYPVRIDSEPGGAAIVILNSDGTRVFEGTTPTTVTLSAKNGYFSGQDYVIEARMAGYETTRMPIARSVDGWYIANVLFGGVIGLLIVDPATGAMWKLEGDVSLTLIPTGDAAPGDLVVIGLDQLPAPDRSRLRRIR